MFSSEPRLRERIPTESGGVIIPPAVHFVRGELGGSAFSWVSIHCGSGKGLGCITQGWCSFEEEQGPALLSSTLAAHAQGLAAELSSLLLSLLGAVSDIRGLGGTVCHWPWGATVTSG